MFFSIAAPQSVTDTVSGVRAQFDVDPADSSRVIARIYQPETNDYLRLTFRRQGTLTESAMVDAEVEADKQARKEAELRQAHGEPAASASDEAKAQFEKDKALLASEPKVSKFEAKEPASG